MLENTFKFKRVNAEEGKALNHFIHTEQQFIHLLKCSEDQDEISEKKKKVNIHQVLDKDFYLGLLKSIKH